MRTNRQTNSRRTTARRIGAAVASTATVAAAFGLTAGAASASVTGRCGFVVNLPRSLATGLAADVSGRAGRTSDQKAFVIAEKANVTVPSGTGLVGLPIDARTIGLRYDSFDKLVQTDRIPVGTKVDSYLIHTDPVGTPAVSKPYTFTVRFSQRVLGVVVTSQRLYHGASDDTKDVGDTLFANPGTTFSPASESGLTGNATLRGLEIGGVTAPDAFTIIDDFTVKFELQTGTATDEARVFTAAAPVDPAASAGYRMVGSDGGIFSYGVNSFHGSLPATNPNVTNVVGATNACLETQGYWFAGSDGAVYGFGPSAPAVAGVTPKAGTRIVSIMRTMQEGGVVLVGNDGTLYPTGTAPSPLFSNVDYTKMASPSSSIIGGAMSPDGKGYWLVSSTGRIYPYGVPDYGSVDFALNAPVVGMALTPSGEGYYLLAKDGGVFAYGDAASKFFGSTGSMVLNKPVVGMQVSSTGEGYYLVAEDGGIFAFGDAAFVGSVPGSLASGQSLNRPVVGMF